MRTLRLRVTVRVMMLMVLTLGGGLGWYVRRAHIQRDAVSQLDLVYGRASYNWEYKNGRYMDGTPWAPKWLVDLVGVDYFGTVTQVEFFGGELKGVPPMSRVGDLKEVESLSFKLVPLSDKDLVYLSQLTKLESLDISFTNVTDAGIMELKNLTRLRWLRVVGTRVTEAGFSDLHRALPNLQIVKD